MNQSQNPDNIRQFSPGDIIIREGDNSDFIYLIRSGTVKVINHYEKENESVITFLGTGEAFGELGVILHRNRLATVIAITDVEVDLIDPEEFNHLLDTELGQRLQPVIRTMAERIRVTGIKLSELGYNIVFNSVSDDNSNRELKLIADSDLALKALQGKEVVNINKFPFRVGRFSEKKSDSLFHKNDLNLYEEKPHKISLSQFSIVRTEENFYFVDRNGGIGNIVNGIKVGGFEGNNNKVELRKGENIIFLGKEHYKLKFKLIL
ncbi:MAG: cyclic nucleotide-binding domain-containing protein [Candidatus Cloacimonetes bacterium]|nr:cyclic nucleotide-binding domain-containing protein [Candidatus Cloacimonadota bacterium]